MSSTPAPRLIVVMGVSGAGKSTVGQLLAEHLGVQFADGDDFHPASNVTRMASGKPLRDVDRIPWLHAIGRWTAAHETGCVVACSALKRHYRDVLRGHHDGLWFLHLAGTPDVLAARMAERPGHFMPPALLDSQHADLEPLADDEWGATVDVSHEDSEQLVEWMLDEFFIR